MNEKIVLENFFSPLTEYNENVAAKLSDSEISLFIKEMEKYIDTKLSSSELEESAVFHWLTHSLAQAMKNKNFALSHHITSLFYKISKKDPDTTLALLEKTFETGDFKGLSGIFVWMDRFYSATFSSIFSPTIIVMNLTFSNLLEHDSDRLSQMMLKPITSGFSTGTNALLNLVYALKNSTEYESNQATTSLIATLLGKFVTLSPDKAGFAITQEVTKGTFSGTNLISLIATTLNKSSKDNIEAVKTICDMLLIVNEKHPYSLMASLTKISQNGYNEGMNALHILLTTLVSAAYIKENSDMVNAFVTLIHEFFKKSPEAISTLLITPITVGVRNGENGIMHLVHALIIAMERNIDTSALTNLLIDVIDYKGNKLENAFNSEAASKSNHYLITPRIKLENKLKDEKMPESQKEELVCILNKLEQVQNNQPRY